MGTAKVLIPYNLSKAAFYMNPIIKCPSDNYIFFKVPLSTYLNDEVLLRQGVESVLDVALANHAQVPLQSTLLFALFNKKTLYNSR